MRDWINVKEDITRTVQSACFLLGAKSFLSLFVFFTQHLLCLSPNCFECVCVPVCMLGSGWVGWWMCLHTLLNVRPPSDSLCLQCWVDILWLLLLLLVLLFFSVLFHWQLSLQPQMSKSMRKVQQSLFFGKIVLLAEIA